METKIKVNPADRKWRRIYQYICNGCMKKRKTFFYDTFLAQICHVCIRDKERAEMLKNQTSIFDSIEPANVDKTQGE